MGSFPFLITLFLFTALAVMAWGARSYAKTEKALKKSDPLNPDVRMAVERSPTGKIMSDLIANRDK